MQNNRAGLCLPKGMVRSAHPTHELAQTNLQSKGGTGVSTVQALKPAATKNRSLVATRYEMSHTNDHFPTDTTKEEK
jgi:hypothetical protein